MLENPAAPAVRVVLAALENPAVQVARVALAVLENLAVPAVQVALVVPAEPAVLAVQVALGGKAGGAGVAGWRWQHGGSVPIGHQIRRHRVQILTSSQK